ncbi:S-layer homology domain-containing protein, partial [Kocuria flava]
MSELSTAVPTRRTLLSAVALLGGAAALAGGTRLSPAVAAEPTRMALTASTASTGYSGLFFDTPETDSGTFYVFRYWSRYSSTQQATALPGATALNRATNIIYAGGKQKDKLGLTATNMSTRAYQLSPETAAIGWVSGMTVAGNILYFGTGDGGIYSHVISMGAGSASSYRRIHSLAGSGQERAESWAATNSHAVFAAVPDGYDDYYGEAPAGTTGALGIINKSTGTVSIRHDLFPGHRVNHLTAIGDTVYGTTRPNGTDYSVAPVVFAFDPATSTVLWQREEPHRTASYWPYEVLHAIVEVLGKLYVSAESAVQEIDPANGARMMTFNAGSPDDYFGRSLPGQVTLTRIEGTNRLFWQWQEAQHVISLPSRLISQITTHGLEDIVYTATGGMLFSDGYSPDFRPVVMHNAWDGMPYRGPVMTPFTDVSTSYVFYNEISWLSEVGVSGGWSTPRGKEFRPTAKVTREIMAAFLYRLAGSPAYTAPATSPFADVATTRAFYKHMAWLAAQGISTGWSGPGGTRLYRPESNVLRDQMAAFMYRLAGEPEFTPPAVSPFIDVPTSHVFG